MAVGNTTTGSLADSLQIIIDSARAVREYDGVYRRVCDVQKLAENTGLSWEEVTLEQFEAQDITENTVLDNPQQFADSLLTITPTVTGISTLVTDRVYRRLAKKTIAEMGPLAMNAINRKADQDYLATIDGATTSLPGASNTLTYGNLSAYIERVANGGGVEPATSPIHIVLHPYQIHDIKSELTAGVGTYTVPTGLTEEIYRRGWMGTIEGANVWRAGNITPDSGDDAKGAVHSQRAIIMVKGHDLTKKTKDRPEVGGGASEIFMYDEWAFGERFGGYQLIEVMSDAAAPTS